MNKSIIPIFASFLILIVGCQGVDLTEVSDKDLQRISEQIVVCKAPYMRFGTGCCLDQNNNNICDSDEGSKSGSKESQSAKQIAGNSKGESVDTAEKSIIGDKPSSESDDKGEEKTDTDNEIIKDFKIVPLTEILVDISDFPRMFLIGPISEKRIGLKWYYEGDLESAFNKLKRDIQSRGFKEDPEYERSISANGKEIETRDKDNLIIIGPCVNPSTLEITYLDYCENPDHDFVLEPGKGRIKLINKEFYGSYILIITGYSQADVRLAAGMLIERTEELEGTDIIVEGVTTSDAIVEIKDSSKLKVSVPSEE